MLASSYALVLLACVALRCSQAFLPSAPRALRGDAALVAAAGAAALASTPEAADAFVYNGKEYFDVTFGISPLAWFMGAFCILFYGATLKNAMLKYNKPYGSNTVANPEPIIGRGKKFVGMEVLQGAKSYKAKVKYAGQV